MKSCRRILNAIHSAVNSAMANYQLQNQLLFDHQVKTALNCFLWDNSGLKYTGNSLLVID